MATIGATSAAATTTDPERGAAEEEEEEHYRWASLSPSSLLPYSCQCLNSRGSFESWRLIILFRLSLSLLSSWSTSINGVLELTSLSREWVGLICLSYAYLNAYCLFSKLPFR